MDDIEIRELRRIEFKDSVMIDGFPSVGLVSSIVSNYLVTLLRLEYVGFVDSPHFPSVTLIRDSMPMATARLYAVGDAMPGDKQLAVFTSELQPSDIVVKPLGERLIDWAVQNKIRLVVSVGGLIIEREETESEEIVEADQVAVYGIASSSRANKYLERADVEPFVEGVITGTSGILLREGKKRGVDVVVLLTEARQEIADAKAAVLLLTTIDQMVLRMNLELGPLLREAEAMEERLAELKSQTEKKARIHDVDAPVGYH